LAFVRGWDDDNAVWEITGLRAGAPAAWASGYGATYAELRGVALTSRSLVVGSFVSSYGSNNSQVWLLHPPSRDPMRFPVALPHPLNVNNAPLIVGVAADRDQVFYASEQTCLPPSDPCPAGVYRLAR
jgi:hypothetical protein